MASGPDQYIAKSRKEGVKMGRPATYRKSEDALLILDDPFEALFRTGLVALFRGCPKHCRDVAVNFSNNLHVDILRMSLIVNRLWVSVKARLPIFSCNPVLTLIANVLCVSVLCYSRKCRLFYFCPNHLLLNFGKLFSGRYSLRDLQVSEYHIVERFQSCQKHNSENG